MKAIRTISQVYSLLIYITETDLNHNIIYV